MFCCGLTVHFEWHLNWNMWIHENFEGLFFTGAAAVEVDQDPDLHIPLI